MDRHYGPDAEWELQHVPLAQMPEPYLNSETLGSERQQIAEMRRHGLEKMPPVVAVPQDDGTFHRPDGNHRTQAYLEEGHSHIPAMVLRRKP